MTHLWAVNSSGKVFTLSTAEQQWNELQYCGLEFKRIASLQHCIWAVGGDHQIYLYIPQSDVPIRCREITYENERWNPYGGFSSTLLPTDRPHWSSADGLVSLPKEYFRLPSESWQWEGSWFIEDNFEGHQLDHEGWMYAVDFPMQYSPVKKWNSLVRRRKWICYRRFVAFDCWTPIPSIHSDPVQEPFIDVSIGGEEIPGGDSNHCAVWTITVMKRVLFRYGVTRTSPEGQGWIPVETPDQCEVNQISVGPTGLVWAVSWNGCCFVRTGVTRERIIGSDWRQVLPPCEDDGISYVSVGTNVVWASSRSGKVWFRKGIRGQEAGVSEASAMGNGWVEMVGKMSILSVGPCDQVWALSNDSTIFFRDGVTSAELSGKTWKPLHLPVYERLYRRSSSISLLSQSSSSTTKEVFDTSDDIDCSILNMKSRPICEISSPRFSTTYSSRSHSCSSTPSRSNSVKLPHSFKPIESSSSASSSPLSIHRTFQNTNHDSTSEVFSGIEMRQLDNVLAASKHSVFRSEMQDSGYRKVSSCSLDSGSYIGDFPSEIWCSSMSEDYCLQSVENAPSWIWISATSCMVDSSSLPRWFTTGGSSLYFDFNEPWHEEILSLFQQRYDKEVKEFASLPQAIEKTTWIKTGTCQVWNTNHHWVNCHLELQQQGPEHGPDRGLLTFLYGKGEHDKVSLDLIEITTVLRAFIHPKPCLAVYSAKQTDYGNPVKLAFRTDKEMEEWLATLNCSLRNVWDLRFKPEKTSIFALTVQGDIYVHSSENIPKENYFSKMLWSLLGGGHLRIIETCPAGVVWGIGYNNTCWVYTGGYGGGVYRGFSGCNIGVCPMTDVKNMYIYENQRWNPVTGFSTRGLPTDRYSWSDKTGCYECTKENTKLPSIHWQWISDWSIDFRTPGGVNNEGWQFATDFPRSYHSYKSFTDYVRRRRWLRKCKLTTTGPFQEMSKIPLLDVSLQVDHNGDPDEPILVWAIATNGDVFCRQGVTISCPQGTFWIHVPTDQPFRSISVGGGFCIWAIAKDGSAYLRHDVSHEFPAGTTWFHVEHPEGGKPLRQISVGLNSIFAVDENNKLWSRQESVPVYRAGTHWKHVSDNVKMVSVGPEDQVWAVMDSMSTISGSQTGVICFRKGICVDDNVGTGWEQSTGSGWHHLTVRGCKVKET